MSQLKRRVFFLFIYIISLGLHAQESVYINEFLARNHSIQMDPDFYAFSDWIELKNGTDRVVDLKDMSLVYEADESYKWIISNSHTIDPGGYLLIWADENNVRLEGLHANFKLQEEGGRLSLLDPSGDTLSTVLYGKQEFDVSYGRSPEDDTWLYYVRPSPSIKNSSFAFSDSDRLGGPKFSIEGGVFESTQTIELSSNSSIAKIYYTLDGSKPDLSSLEYTHPIEIRASTVVRAIAFDNKFLASRVVTQSYFISEDIQLPIVSISMDSLHFWDDEIGFYVEGTNGLTGWEAGYGPSAKSNFNQNWRRPMHIEFFDEEHEAAFSMEGEVKVYGGWSRGAVIKSLAIYPEKSINYRLFKEKTFVDYESFILRNSGNDWPSTKIRDAALQSLIINQIDVDLQGNRPAVLFINGKFWGVLNIREKINEDYVFTNHGVSQDSVDFLEKYTVVKSGDRSHYLKMMNYLNTHSLVEQSNYEYIKTLVDVEECLNYFISGIYAGHGDWIYNGNNNLRLWRPRTNDGRWRWLLYDTDGVFKSSSGRGIEKAVSASPILAKLLENEEARNYFISTFTALLNNALTGERAVQMIDSLKLLIEPDVGRHIEKWKNTDASGNLADWKNPDKADYIQVDDGYMGPCLSSYSEWESDFTHARNVALQRPSWLLGEIESYFGLAPVDVKFRINKEASGIIEVEGVEVLDYDDTDVYMYGQSLSLRASAKFGHVFKHWELSGFQADDTILVAKGSEWSYLDDGTDPGSSWKSIDFNDQLWKAGRAELGYGDGGEVSVLDYGTDANNKYITTYFRKKIVIDKAEEIDELRISLMRDDGALVYINGEEVVRDNLPTGVIDGSTFASSAVSGSDESSYYSYSIPSTSLKSGDNIVCIELHQISRTSSDLSFDLEFVARKNTELNLITESSREINFTPQGNSIVKAVFETEVNTKELYINEFMADNQLYSWVNEEGDGSDWIEIYNGGDHAVNLAGMFVTDNLENPMFYQIPSTDMWKTHLPSQEHLVLYADGKPALGPLHLGFKINREREEIGLAELYARDVVFHDTLSFGKQMMDVSYGRYPDGGDQLLYMAESSPEAQNHYDVSEVVTGIYINEFSCENLGFLADNFGEYDDWIEIYNSNDYDVDMAGMFMSDDFNDPARMRIPFQYSGDVLVPANGYVVFWADDDMEQGLRHVNFKLDNEKEAIGIFQLIGQEFVVVDTLSYSNTRGTISRGRYPDAGDSFFAFGQATPGQSNVLDISENQSVSMAELRIFPNPSSGRFIIDFGEATTMSEEYTLHIYDMRGRQVLLGALSNWSSSDSTIEIDLGGYPKGIYFVKLDGISFVKSAKIVIQ